MLPGFFCINNNMVTFKDYLLEYTKSAEEAYANIASMKSGKNGKSWNRIHTRKNPNTVAKDYKHKHPLVGRVVRGEINNVRLNNAQLLQITKAYPNVHLKPNNRPKTLGNSGAEIVVSLNRRGKYTGILRKKVKKVKNGL